MTEPEQETEGQELPADASSTPETELQHDPAHTFTVTHQYAAPGTSGPPETHTSSPLSVSGAIAWLKDEFARL